MSEQIDIDINVNVENIEEVDELSEKLDEVSSKAEEVNDNTVSPDVDNSGIDETNEKLDETNGKLQETESSASSLTTALGGIAGVVGLDQMVETADRIQTSYNQLSLTFDGTGISIDTLRTKSSQLSESTGRSGSQIREYFNNMGIAGIRNTDLLSSSFESLAGKAYQTNQPIEAMESKMQKMVMTGTASNKMLTGLGITAESLGRAMGVSGDEAAKAFEALDQEGRLQALTTAMGDGKEANEMYKNSYVGLKQQAETAMAGLMGAIGQGVLPVITPMIRGATGIVKSFTSTFKSLPGPVQGAVGAVGGFLAVGTATIGTLGLVGQVGSGVVNGLKSMKSGYDGIKTAMGTAKTMMDALRNSESITQGVRAALAIATGAEATAEGASTAAKGAAIGPTTGLAIAENSLLWPLLLIVGAVVAVIAVMWYLYNTNETVRNGINWLVAQVQAFINSLMPVVNAIINFVTKGLAYLNTFPGGVHRILLKVITFIFTWQAQLVAAGIRAAASFITNVGSHLRGITSTVSSALSGVYNAVTSPFKRAYDYVYNNVIKPLKSAWAWVSSAFNGYEGYEGYTSFEGYSGMNDTLNGTISNISNNTGNSNSSTINNNFYGLVEESAADYIVGAVNDRLRREKLLKGA